MLATGRPRRPVCSKSPRQVPVVRLAHTCVYSVSSPQCSPQGNFRASLSVSKLLPPSLGQPPSPCPLERRHNPHHPVPWRETSFLSPAAAEDLPAPPGPLLLACCLCPREGPGALVLPVRVSREDPKAYSGHSCRSKYGQAPSSLTRGPGAPRNGLPLTAPRAPGATGLLPHQAAPRTVTSILPLLCSKPSASLHRKESGPWCGCLHLGPSPRVRLSFLWPRQASSLSAGPGADQSAALAARGLLSRAPEHSQSSLLARLSRTAFLPHNREGQGRTASSLQLRAGV